ncbi:phosphoribosylglycinamide formyltransferase [Ferruginibacter sp.]|uniref:phosphoribosylglycinamide formyltransferase n=1 Tax=Ferruginibacter sp. TaxID=1940288 RepID=UPI0019B2AAD7|nr:phosphoribosylglycinamide formyltransferase [Ferruginibacter sp.]MBC7628091.1 phosphoribosylglycinamide formyltransferase [Ferruginibacter sp.]
MDFRHIAIFASGAGSNAKQIIEHFKFHTTIKVSLIVCNKQGAGVLKHAINHEVPTLFIEKERFFSGDGYVPQLFAASIDFIVLAGFLWKIPLSIIKAYPNKIINIHPALLPNYGGKGMYGTHVHTAVIDAGDNKSGISIHYVDEHYDNGDIIFQAYCDIEANDNPSTLADKIHLLEHQYYPNVVEKCIRNLGSKIKLAVTQL